MVPPVSPRHRLTITVTDLLYEELCRLAGPRRISEWMEDAAWRKIQVQGCHEPQPGPAPEPPVLEVRPPHGFPPPPWRWSPLRPAGTE